MVMIVNAMNDFAELGHPNTERHTAVDGWAARITSSSPPPTSRLRELLIRRSHMTFALWRWQRTRAAAALPEPPDDGLDALFRAADDAYMAALSEARRREEIQQRAAARAATQAVLDETRQHLKELLKQLAPRVAGAGIWSQEWTLYQGSEGDPEARLLYRYYGGCIPSDSPTYRTLFASYKVRSDVEAAYRASAQAPPPELMRDLELTFARRANAERDLDLGRGGWNESALFAEQLAEQPIRAFLKIEPVLARANAIATTRNARLVVVAVPLDAQISRDARERRALPERRVLSLDALMAALAESARVVGAVGVDATAALRQAGDTAYLRDGHLAAAGHEALARAIAEALREGR
ncbi:Hypothetical protein A7982_03126 [Minicystis rosea]|nr:Hypothetical protein A7982_03126 [Minicystis rosea]